MAGKTLAAELNPQPDKRDYRNVAEAQFLALILKFLEQR
jgi:hypothetical protein